MPRYMLLTKYDDDSLGAGADVRMGPRRHHRATWSSCGR